MKRKLFVATHNAHKVGEIAAILPDWEIVSDDPVGVEENAPDFVGNARIKVRAIAARHRGDWCLADDSGLEVAALGGAPGVRSARYAGEPSNTPANNALLLKNLAGVADRRANLRVRLRSSRRTARNTRSRGNASAQSPRRRRARPDSAMIRSLCRTASRRRSRR